MSYAEVVRFISVQPFPLQHHHRHHRLLLSLSLHFSRIRSFASPIFSCPTRLTLPIPPSFFPYFISSALPCFFIQFPLFSPPFSFHLLFSDSENCTLLSGETLIFRERSSETSLFLPKFSLPMEFSMYHRLKIKCGYSLSLSRESFEY